MPKSRRDRTGEFFKVENALQRIVFLGKFCIYTTNARQGKINMNDIQVFAFSILNLSQGIGIRVHS